VNSHSRPGPRRPRARRARVGLAELQRVADQVLEQLRELRFVARIVGSLSCVTVRRILDRGAQVGERAPEGRLGLGRLEVLVAVPTRE